MSRRKWDFDSVTAEAQKYNSATEFKYGSPGAFKWAERNNMLQEILAPIRQRHGGPTDPGQLMAKIEGELGSASRYAKVAHDIWTADPSPFASYERSDSNPELISEGTYLDFECQMFDQASIERSDRALDYIEALKEHGTPEQIHQAWVMYLQYQTGTWDVEGCDTGIYMQGEEQGGSGDT